MTTDLAHNPLTVAERLAPVPATREEATAYAWVRHHAAAGLAAFTMFDRGLHALTPNPEKGPRPDLGYLVALGVASMHAAYAVDAPGLPLPGEMWDLTPEAGALNGEWEEWLAETLDRYGINPADINPAYNSADFNSSTQGERADAR